MGIALRCSGASYWGRATRSLSITYFTLSLLHYITSLNLSRALRTPFFWISSGSFQRTLIESRTLSSGPTLYILRLPQTTPFSRTCSFLLLGSFRLFSSETENGGSAIFCWAARWHWKCDRRAANNAPFPATLVHQSPPNRSHKNQSPIPTTANKLKMSGKKKNQTTQLFDQN